MSRKTRLLITIILISTVLIPTIVWFVTSNINKGKTIVKVSSVPPDAIIKFNDQNGKVGTNRLKPGQYKVTAYKSGFELATKEISVNNTEQQLSFLLTPVSESAKEWAKNNQSLLLNAEQAAGDAQQEEGEAFTEKNPLVGQLPYHSLLFNIDYKHSATDTSRAIIIIEAGDSIKRGLAISHIQNLGYQPSDYEIEFSGYKNPLTGDAL